MNRAVLIKRLQEVREHLVKIARARHGSFGINAMDLKKVLDQTVRELKREVNKKVLKVPEIEIKVCEATSNEPWGPHGTIMGDIAQATRNLQEYHLIMGVLWKRLHDSGKNWRHVYKSLTVMEYLIANGAERVIDELREQAYQIQALLDFQHIEPNGKDQGINVQKKAESVLALINDRGKIREVRQKAAANRDKYRGVSNTGMAFKPTSYLSTSGSYDDEEQYGGGSSTKAHKDDVEGTESCRSQRPADLNSCWEKELNDRCASSKGGDPNSDQGSSTDGGRSLDIDDYRHYSRAPGNQGVVAAVTRAQTNVPQASSGPTPQLFFTINPATDHFDDDFDPRRTSKRSVPVAKDESRITNQNAALEDLFADVEFQASYPPAITSVSDLQAPSAFSEAFKANSVPTPVNKAEIQLFGQIDGTSFDSFNPSFASFDESPKSTTQGVLLPNGGAQTVEQVPSNTVDFFDSFNPFATKDQRMEATRNNPFVSTTSSAFWDDPLITSLVDLSIGPKKDQNASLSMNGIASSTADSLQLRHMNNSIGSGRFMSDLPKSS